MEAFFNSLGHIISHTSLDTIKAVPILFCVYILVSYFGHNSHKYTKFFKKAEKFGPVVGSTIGIIPQCGFSVVMADLYNKKSISLGTLIAVFIATSDEAIPILFSNYNFFVPMIMLILIKLVYAILVGYLIDFILKIFKKRRQNKIIITHPEHGACECGHEDHDHEHTNHCCADNIFIDAIKHTLKITLFMFIFNFIITAAIEFSGFEITTLANINKYIQTLITALIGLIPNCAASILLVTIYMGGGIAFGALLAGLCTSAGLGILMLFKNGKKSLPENFAILGITYILGVILGIIVNLIY